MNKLELTRDWDDSHVTKLTPNNSQVTFKFTCDVSACSYTLTTSLHIIHMLHVIKCKWQDQVISDDTNQSVCTDSLSKLHVISYTCQYQLTWQIDLHHDLHSKLHVSKITHTSASLPVMNWFASWFTWIFACNESHVANLETHTIHDKT